MVGHRHLTVTTAPLSVTADGRRVVPNRAGFYLRLATGSLAGYEVQESPVAYVIGRTGHTRYDPPESLVLTVGRYLGYRFTADWRLADTQFGQVTSRSTVSATRRAVINGRAYRKVSSGDWTGFWLPLVRPRASRAQPITCTVPAKPPAGSGVVLTRVPTDEPRVALTFDLGGRLDPAVTIMERLILDRVCATINPTGATATTSIGTDVMALVKAHPELFEVGNHTMHHCHLRDGGEGANCPADPPTTKQIQAELTKAATVIRDLTGLEPTPYWRPPFGEYDAGVLAAAAGIGYTKTLMWDVDTIDWMPTDEGGPTAASMADKVVTTSTNGSIVLMHLGGYHTFDALPSMVLRLRAAGLAPTTVSDLLD